MQFGGARWSPGAARGLPGGYRAQNEGLRKFGAPPYIIVKNQTPNGAREARKVLWDDDLAPFSNNKIQAKILDLQAPP